MGLRGFLNEERRLKRQLDKGRKKRIKEERLAELRRKRTRQEARIRKARATKKPLVSKKTRKKVSKAFGSFEIKI